MLKIPSIAGVMYRTRHWRAWVTECGRLAQPLLKAAPPISTRLMGVGESAAAPWLYAAASHTLDHRFDILGSGWTRVTHGMSCRGVEGVRYDFDPSMEVSAVEGFTAAARVRAWYARRLLSPAYVPIDWHRDFKSGFRWRDDTPYKRVRYGHDMGADIKVPWELARAHHLVWIARAYHVALSRRSLSDAAGLSSEFRDQVLDFISANPTGYGVNWRCSMDVGIRLVNWLIAYDLFCSAGAKFGIRFDALFSQCIQEHARHIIHNLEWSPERRGNHYLANIVGLLFAAAYLPRSNEVDSWLAFSLRELQVEIRRQFNNDGSNFEGSTAYHRLSAEMVFYAIALLLGMPQERLDAVISREHVVAGAPDNLAAVGAATEPFPSWLVERLHRMGEFCLDITRPDGFIVQVGDNDSGRLLKLDPTFRRMRVAHAVEVYDNLEGYNGLTANEDYWFEVHNDVRHLWAVAAQLLDRPDLVDTANKSAFAFERRVVEVLSRGRSLPNPAGTPPLRKAAQCTIGLPGGRDCALQSLDCVDECSVYEYEPKRGPSLTEGLETAAYPDFGLYVFSSPRLWASVRCGPIGQNGVGGHAHNDQLSVELLLDGEALLVDPGTYLYTPVPERRNRYRSVRAHWAPRLADREPGTFGRSLFQLGNEARARCIWFRAPEFIGRHDGFGVPVWRRVEILPDRVRITDWCEAGHTSMDLTSQVAFSPGYGWRVRSASAE